MESEKFFPLKTELETLIKNGEEAFSELITKLEGTKNVNSEDAKLSSEAYALKSDLQYFCSDPLTQTTTLQDLSEITQILYNVFREANEQDLGVRFITLKIEANNLLTTINDEIAKQDADR